MQLLEQTNQKEETETPEVQDQQVVPFEDTTTDVGKNPLVKKLQSIAILWLLVAGSANVIHFFFPKEADISITRFIVGCLCTLINVAASLAFLISTVKYFVDSLSNFNTSRIEHISNFKISRRWFNKPH